MNKSLRFLAIGLALAVLLVSQVGVDRSTEAAPIEEKNDTVEFAGPAGTGDAAEQQDFYRPGVTVDFYLKDPDLALPTGNRTATVTFTVPSGTVTGGNGFTLIVPPDPLNGDPSGTYAPQIGTNGTTTAETGFGAGVADNGVSDETTFMANEHWMGYMGTADTPLDGTPVVTVRNADQPGQNGNRLVTSSNPETGVFAIFENVNGRSPTTDDDPATTTIEVTFKYHVADKIGADQRAGTTAGSDENRVRITSSSDGIGEWVPVTEVVAIGSTTTNPTSNIYYGSIYLEPDSSKASKNDGEIGVRDGDTLTVTLYEDDHVTVVDDDTATIDGEKPAILSISPGDKTVTDRSSPVVTVTVTDAGSGIDTSFPRDHVDISIVDGDDTCRIPDIRLTATRLSGSEVDILFRNTGSWIIGGSGLPCDMSPDIGDGGNVAEHNVDSISIIPGENNHGRQFTIEVVARDVAGNEQTKSAKVTIDTRAPALVDGSTTGMNWDAKKEEETADPAAIKLVFNEGLDADSVDVSDFVVENPDVSVESVQVAGADAENDEGEERGRLPEALR